MATKLGQSESNLDKIALQSVADMAESLGAGQYAARLCPQCEGGGSRERSLSLDIGSNGVVKFYCHRASCEFKGSIYAGGPIGPVPQRSDGADHAAGKPRGNNPLTAPLYPLTAEDTAWFKRRFYFDPPDSVKRTETRYALPILRPDGSTRGYITRRPWDGSPLDTEASRHDSQYAMKALTYLDAAEEPVQSWYSGKRGSKLIIVEDQISAMRLAEYGETLAVCAILGTGINAQKVHEIQSEFISFVTIALDADATGQAFAMARKWGPAFESCRVCVLPKDIKDMTPGELDALNI